jgi:hypothetical protein
MTAERIMYTAYMTEHNASNIYMKNIKANRCSIGLRFRGGVINSTYENAQFIDCDKDISITNFSKKNKLINTFYSDIDMIGQADATAEYTFNGWNGTIMADLSEDNQAIIRNATYSNGVLLVDNSGIIKISP